MLLLGGCLGGATACAATTCCCQRSGLHTAARTSGTNVPDNIIQLNAQATGMQRDVQQAFKTPAAACLPVTNEAEATLCCRFDKKHPKPLV